MSDSIINIIINTIKKGGGDKEQISQFKKLSAAVKEFTGFSLGSVTAVGAAAMALRTIKQVAREGMEAFLELSNNVEQFMQITGDSAETTSRFIQMVDDERISIDTLQKIMNGAAKKGYDVSVASIAAMSDEFRTLKTEQEQNLFLTEHFGKSGLAFERVMRLGSAAIYQRMGAISENLVVDEEAIAKTVEFQEAIDAWNDSIDGVKIKIGEELTPVISDYALVLADLVEKSNKGNASFVKTEAVLMALSPVVAAVAYTVKAFNLGVGSSADKLRKQQDGTESSEWAMQNYKTTARETYDLLSNGLNPSLDSAAEKWGSLAWQEDFAAHKAEGALTAIRMVDKDILSLTQKLMDAYEEEAGEREKATRRIIFAYIEQQLAADGYTEAEMNYLIALGDQWEIYSAEVASQAGFVINQAALISNALSNIPKELTVSIAMIQSGNIDLNGYSMTGTAGSTVPTGSVATGVVDPATGRKQYKDADGSFSYRASGGPVYAGEAYIVGENGPEPFIPAVDGRIISNEMAFGNNYVSISISGAGDPKAVAREVMRELNRQGVGRA
jgi:hypothetical protein